MRVRVLRRGGNAGTVGKCTRATESDDGFGAEQDVALCFLPRDTWQTRLCEGSQKMPRHEGQLSVDGTNPHISLISPMPVPLQRLSYSLCTTAPSSCVCSVW